MQVKPPILLHGQKAGSLERLDIINDKDYLLLRATCKCKVVTIPISFVNTDVVMIPQA